MLESARIRTQSGSDCDTFHCSGLAEARGEQQARVNVRWFNHGIGFQNGFPAGAIREHGQNNRGRDSPSSVDEFAAHFPSFGSNANEKIVRIHIQLHNVRIRSSEAGGTRMFYKSSCLTFTHGFKTCMIESRRNIPIGRGVQKAISSAFSRRRKPKDILSIKQKFLTWSSRTPVESPMCL